MVRRVLVSRSPGRVFQNRALPPESDPPRRTLRNGGQRRSADRLISRGLENPKAVDAKKRCTPNAQANRLLSARRNGSIGDCATVIDAAPIARGRRVAIDGSSGLPSNKADGKVTQTATDEAAGAVRVAGRRGTRADGGSVRRAERRADIRSRPRCPPRCRRPRRHQHPR